jgi:hypothetical protein
MCTFGRAKMTTRGQKREMTFDGAHVVTKLRFERLPDDRDSVQNEGKFGAGSWS